MTVSNNIPAWRDALTQRLRDTRGFMLAEQLVSIIFIGLLCIAVAAGLGAAMSSYAKITLQTQADAMLSQAVEVVSNELVYSLGVEDGSTKFTSATRHEQANLEADGQGVWLNADGARECLVPVENGLTPTLDNLEYNASARTWTFHIAINSGGKTLAGTTMTVKRIGS
ncbi:hypothetical protein [Eggerthella sinensis]|uniref:hypothetical protein n=1 Tax=Eggerthella sinensis TaxID=242230 RepID=UPI00266C6263|nr:hypothetical protein [Eggerthella sinensis]